MERNKYYYITFTRPDGVFQSLKRFDVDFDFSCLGTGLSRFVPFQSLKGFDVDFDLACVESDEFFGYVSIPERV